MDNVIDFKAMKEKREKEKSSEQEGDFTDGEFFAFLGMNAACDIVMVLEENGLNPRENPACMRDIFLIIEAIRGLGHRLKGEEYTMHMVSDSLFNIFKNEEKILEEFLENVEQYEEDD